MAYSAIVTVTTIDAHADVRYIIPAQASATIATAKNIFRRVNRMVRRL